MFIECRINTLPYIIYMYKNLFLSADSYYLDLCEFFTKGDKIQKGLDNQRTSIVTMLDTLGISNI